jgi:hypothetical protein
MRKMAALRQTQPLTPPAKKHGGSAKHVEKAGRHKFAPFITTRKNQTFLVH